MLLIRQGLDGAEGALSVLTMRPSPPIPLPVAKALADVPASVRPVLEQVRALIFDVAASDAAIGPVSETLKWGQPSYAVACGTPLRLGLSRSGAPALLAHCQSSVIADARALFGADLCCEGTRAVMLPAPEGMLRQIILAALTYRLRASSGRSA